MWGPREHRVSYSTWFLVSFFFETIELISSHPYKYLRGQAANVQILFYSDQILEEGMVFG